MEKLMLFTRTLLVFPLAGILILSTMAGAVVDDPPPPQPDPVPCDSAGSFTLELCGGALLTPEISTAEPGTLKFFLKQKLEEMIAESSSNPGCAECEFNDACTERIFLRDGTPTYDIEPNPETGLFDGRAALFDQSRFTVDCSACVDEPHIDPPG